MITDFLYKYYIDPVRFDQPYNIVETLTYALILIGALYLVYRWLRRAHIPVDREFILATLPYVVLGALVRAIYDTGMVTSDLRYLLVTPLVYFVIFFYTITVLVVSRTMTAKEDPPAMKVRKGNRRSLPQDTGTRGYLRWHRNVGILSCLVIALLLGYYGLTRTTIALDVLLIIMTMAIAAFVAVWGFMRYILRWEYASDLLFVVLIFGHMLDASATAYGIDLHPIAYIEEHVVGNALITWSGTAFSFFPLKLLILFPAIYVLQASRGEIQSDLWHLVVFAMIIVGLAPGIRDMVQMALYV